MAVVSTAPGLPTLYEHYTSGGVHSGLSSGQPYFTLNDRNITLYSGAMHYFRVPREYWRDRLRKMRAAGLNAVETYVPWNLHEPQENVFDFGDGGTDMEQFLDVREYLKIAQEEDLLAIVRPGPYICSEWEFGGFPSWLLRYKGLKVRTSQQAYMQHVRRYFDVLLPILALLQFTKGGPIIAFQVENEYGSTGSKSFVPDKEYLRELRELMLRNGLVELLFTSDNPTSSGDSGTLPEYFLQTANFAGAPEVEFKKLKQLQKNRPSMAMEYWTGWFDHWSEEHHLRNDTQFADVLERILKYPASVNMYMFHGGTNFGFMNGANIADGSTDNKGYQPDTTSYDYDSPLRENGDYTEKYVIVKRLLNKYATVRLRTPLTPSEYRRVAYPDIDEIQQLTFDEVLERVPHRFRRADLMPMEYLPINNNSGQSYGYIVYRKTNVELSANSILTIGGRVCDTVMVLLNGVLVSPPLRTVKDLNGFGYWRSKDSSLTLPPFNFRNATLDLVVENWGRNNFGRLDQFLQHKGLWQAPVYINSRRAYDWEIVPLEFKTSWSNSLSGWHKVDVVNPQPALYRATLTIDGEPRDTYLDMSDWCKGLVMVNGFVLGRYAVIGPQRALYLPAPLVHRGHNELLVFEHFYPARALKFATDPIYKTTE